MKLKMEKVRSKYTDKFEFLLRINGNIESDLNLDKIMLLA